MHREPVVPYVWMLEACVIFTAMGTMAHALRNWCPWQIVAVFRASLVFVIVASISWYRGKRILALGPPTLWIRSIAGSLSMVCTFYALSNLPVSATLTLTNLFPIWVAILSWPLLGERPPAIIAVAIASGTVGIYLVQQPHFGEADLAIAAGVAASFFTAVAMLGLHRLRGLDSQAIVIHFSAVATCFCFASLFVFEVKPVAEEVALGWIVLLLLGVGASASIGQILLTRAFAHGNPSRVSVVGLSQIIFALLPDMLLFQHDFDALTLTGILLIAAPTGWLLSQHRWRRDKPMEEDIDPESPDIEAHL